MKKIFATLLIVFGISGFLYNANIADAKRPNLPSIKDIAVSNGNFDILEAAVIKAGLVNALDGNRQYTVFAPTDEAFITYLEVSNEAEAIDKINNEIGVSDLQDILLYHVTSGRRISDSVLGAPTYKMINGDKLTREELVNAGIAETDIQASNGIVHIINTVLEP